jgi:hypothetical protein
MIQEYIGRPDKIMLIRHAEKPSVRFPQGINHKGESEKESLVVRGWQRAGALIPFFAPLNGHPAHPAIVRPDFIYASKPKKHNGSLRPFETVRPLAEKLGLNVNCHYLKTDYAALIEEVFSRTGAVLICWQHDFIPKIAGLLATGKKDFSAEWPEDRFDLVWVFDREPSENRYRFSEVHQNLLAGDLPAGPQS